RALGERDGVCGVNFLRVFLGPGEPPALLAAHARHIARTAGEHVPALGADFTHFLPKSLPEAPGLGLPAGSDRTLTELPPLDRAPVCGELAALLDGEAGRAAIMAGNALRVLDRVLT